MKHLAMLSVFLALPVMAAEKPLPPGRYVVPQCPAAASPQACAEFFPPVPTCNAASLDTCARFASDICPTCAECPAPVQVRSLPAVSTMALVDPAYRGGMDSGGGSANPAPPSDAKLKTWQKWLIGGVAVAFVAVVVNNELHDTGSPLPPRKKPCDGGPDCY